MDINISKTEDIYGRIYVKKASNKTQKLIFEILS